MQLHRVSQHLLLSHLLLTFMAVAVHSMWTGVAVSPLAHT